MDKQVQPANFTHGMAFVAYFLLAQSFGLFDMVRAILGGF